MLTLIGLSSVTYAEQWIFLKQTAQNDIYVDVEKVRQVEIDNQRYKQAWIKTVAIQDNTAMQKSKGDYTQALWRFDCANATSSILNYVDYNKAGQMIESGFIENPTVQVILPNSIEENALLAVCDGKYPQQKTSTKIANKVTATANKVNDNVAKKVAQTSTATKQVVSTTQQTVQTKANQAATATKQATSTAKQVAHTKASQATTATKQATSTVKQVAQTKASQATTATKQATSTAKQAVQNKVDKTVKAVTNPTSKK